MTERLLTGESSDVYGQMDYYQYLVCRWAFGVCGLVSKVNQRESVDSAFQEALKLLAEREVVHPRPNTKSRIVPKWRLPWAFPAEYDQLLATIEAGKDEHAGKWDFIHNIKGFSITASWQHDVMPSGVSVVTEQVAPNF